MQARAKAEGIWSRAWRRRRRRVAVFAAVWIGTAAAGALLGLVAPGLLGSLPGAALVAVLALLTASWLAVLAFPCPRCRRPYHWDWTPHPLARRCVHCGLSKNQPEPPDPHARSWVLEERRP